MNRELRSVGMDAIDGSRSRRGRARLPAGSRDFAPRAAGGSRSREPPEDPGTCRIGCTLANPPSRPPRLSSRSGVPGAATVAITVAGVVAADVSGEFVPIATAIGEAWAGEVVRKLCADDREVI